MSLLQFVMEPTDPRVTQLLQEWSEGNQEALERLLPLVYSELLRCARAEFRRERPGHTLQPTAVVNEVYLKLVSQKKTEWRNRAQFFGFTASLMRRILTDHYRKKIAGKRPPAELRISLTEDISANEIDSIDLLWLNDALTKLEAFDATQARIVELRFFAGLSVEEAAEVLGVSPTKVKREWSMAKAWLLRELSQP